MGSGRPEGFFMQEKGKNRGEYGEDKLASHNVPVPILTVRLTLVSPGVLRTTK
jgi:hypothetical protein